MVRTAHREVEENKRSWCAFRGDLVKDIARMAVRKDRGPRVDNSIGVLRLWVGIPLKEDVIGHHGDVRKNVGVSQFCWPHGLVTG